MTDLDGTEPTVTGEVVTPLTAEQAEVLTALAVQQAADLWRTLLQLYEGEAHTALGYSS